MVKKQDFVNIQLKAERIIFACNDVLKDYRKLRLKGHGTKRMHFLIDVPKHYIGESYYPTSKYSLTFGLNKENNHKLVVIDLDDQKKTKNWIKEVQL